MKDSKKISATKPWNPPEGERLFEQTRKIAFAAGTWFVSKLHGKCYATIVMLDADNKPSAMSVLGPFKTERQAKKEGNKWVNLNIELRKHGEAGLMPHLKTVPDEVREYITCDVRAALEHHKDTVLSRKMVFGRQPKQRR